uniref:helix-turn-helix domain-containing protein n=1 Tax=Candidatus Stercorousia sp. TaxID=3048886 RepID=UPI004027AA77
RKAKKLTQEQLAEIVNMEPNSISIIESGRNFPTLNSLEKIAKALDVELNILFRYNLNKTNDEIIDNINLELAKLNNEKLEKVLLFIEDFIL